MTDAAISRTDGRGSSIKNSQNEDTGGQSPAHTSGGGSFRAFLIYLNRPAASVKSGGYLGRVRFHLQFENVCDRSENGFASVVTLLPVFIGQPARPPGEGGDPAGRELRLFGGLSFWRNHFNISSS